MAAYAAIASEYDRAVVEFSKAYREAAEDERAALRDKAPDRAAYGERMWRVAEENPEHEAATRALVWIVTYWDGRSERGIQAFDELIEHRIDSEAIGDIAMATGFFSEERAEQALDRMIERSPHRSVQGRALLVRAEGRARKLEAMRRRGDEKSGEAEAELAALLRSVASDYADVRSSDGKTIGDAAERMLFALDRLAVGKQAPEIEGENGKGAAMKLSHYRGKVVLIDFWGDW